MQNHLIKKKIQPFCYSPPPPTLGSLIKQTKTQTRTFFLGLHLWIWHSLWLLRITPRGLSLNINTCLNIQLNIFELSQEACKKKNNKIVDSLSLGTFSRLQAFNYSCFLEKGIQRKGIGEDATVRSSTERWDLKMPCTG